jgi:xylan 1,4-beta-xylosidase
LRTGLSSTVSGLSSRNGIDKPVLNVFRMFGMMAGDCVKVESSGTAGLDAIGQTDVRQKPDIDALAAHSDRHIANLSRSYHG